MAILNKFSKNTSIFIDRELYAFINRCSYNHDEMYLRHSDIDLCEGISLYSTSGLNYKKEGEIIHRIGSSTLHISGDIVGLLGNSLALDRKYNTRSINYETNVEIKINEIK